MALTLRLQLLLAGLGVVVLGQLIAAWMEASHGVFLGLAVIGIGCCAAAAYSVASGLGAPMESLRRFMESAVASPNKQAEPPRGDFPADLAALRDAADALAHAAHGWRETAQAQADSANHRAQTVESELDAVRHECETVTATLAQLAGGAARAEEISRQVASSVEELAQEVDSVNYGVDTQRDRITEIATAMEEMNATVAEVASSAGAAANQSNESRSLAQTGADEVRAAVESITRIKDRILALKETMATLDTQAASIGQVLSMINDIADQTNLLALNAAIEAARAGEAGRGFAVVADEVRKLAEKTMHATHDVEEAVKGIQVVARENVAAVEATAKDFEDSTHRAEASGRSMEAIVKSVEDASSQVELIATAAEEQSATSEEINRNVTDVTAVANETAEGMARSAQALGAMTGLTGELDAIVREMAQAGAKYDSAGEAITDRKLIEWSDDLAVFIDEVDREHKVLVDLINELNDAMKHRKAQHVVLSVLDRLKTYVTEHFATEERLFDKYGYPDAQKHKNIHKTFVEKILDFEQELKEGKVTLTMDIMRFLKEWLVRHIQGEDKRYAPFLKEKLKR